MSQPQSFDQRVNLYLDNEITAQAFDQLCKELAGDTSLRKRFLKLSALDTAISHTADHQDRHNTIASVLEQGEQEVETDSIFTLYQSIEPRVETLSAPAIRKGDILPLVGYTARLALRDHRVVKGLVAAALIVGMLLTISLIGLGDDPAPIVNSGTSATDDPVSTPKLIAVATLTAERNAVWDRRPGQDLFAGQRFTLAQGFAEITTSDGAIAILQAPATIELLDNNNALHLHAGKLVGICETESSKGFVVRTPHMAVTDLGTRFGVDVRQREATEVHVFEGEVQARHADEADTAEPVRLLAGDAARASDDDDSVTSIDYSADSFAVLMPKRELLAATGRGLGVDEVDPNWRVIAMDGKPLAKPAPARVADPASFESPRREGLRYMPNEPYDSKWVTSLLREAKQHMTYQTKFELGEIDPDSAVLDLRLLADLRVNEVTLNGQPISIPEQSTGPAFIEFTSLSINDGLVAGTNTLTVRVERLPGLGASRSTYWTGFRAELAIIDPSNPSPSGAPRF